ncbi:DUF6056 family protein [Hymenobacter crusticola]|uniref:Glycosyltransferase RgtA/B/C/D-like domain-containing protein n=1 Tax=Hymenobacter crusticola TaxID=1770526 RepID=A0A243WC86_9BACT|nr:DUF6056 family protein [Hymenobacter crusticola]OUJ73148.1 hypothetical protein BXP70_15070 [Hymenobacter crusticola]
MSKVKERVSAPLISSTQQERKVSRVWMVLLALTILPFLLLACYTYPSIHDNYLTANAILRGGRAHYIVKTYYTWSGRYSELVLKAYLEPLTYQNAWQLEKIGAVGVILGFFASIYGLLKVLAKEKKIKSPFASSLLLFTLFLNGLSSVGPVFYWFDGYTAYTAGIIIFLMLLSCLAAMHQTQRSSYERFFYFVGACLATIVGVGTYETVLLALGWLLSTGLIVTFKQKGSTRWWWLSLFLLWLLSACFSLSAPGNLSRAATALPSDTHLFAVGRIMVSGVKSLYFMSSMLLSWSNNLLLILGTIVLLPFVTHRQQECSSFLSIPKARRVISLLLWLVAGLSVCIFPSILVYQDVWEHTWQCVYGFFLLGWAFSASIAFRWLRPRYAIFERALTDKVQLVCRIAFLLICFGGSNSNTNIAYLDLKFRAPEYYQRTLQRTLDMQQAQYSGKVGRVASVLSAPESYKQPKILYTVPYNDNDVVGFAHYYGVDSVLAQP